MSLKQSIIVKNEFSVKRADGGTRGSTPGKYLERYMARDGACDAIYPVFGTGIDRYVEDYMLRSDAVMAEPTVSDARLTAHYPKDGVAFTSGNPSMSARDVHKVSNEIQAAFDSGKTVLKTVLSFDDAYLKERGVLEPTFVARFRGDHSGHVDQMKLREAVTCAMDKLSSSQRFDDLLWVGALQFDTMHVHAHLVAVDRGEGHLTKDGEQKGSLSAKDMRVLRRGLDSALVEMEPVKLYAAQVQADRGHARTSVRRYVYDALDKSSAPQLILASLPDDKRLWRASSNRIEMRRANDITRSYVSQIFRESGSGYSDALLDIEAYANARALREGLNSDERMQLVRRGVRRLEEDCVNGVYDVLRNVEDADRVMSTPMLDLAAQEIIDLADEANDDPMADFGFRVRSYAGRMRYHRDARRSYRSAVREYEQQGDEVVEQSRPVIDFYRFEEQYHTELMSKYQSLLQWYPYERDYELQLAELTHDVDVLCNWEKMYHDEQLGYLSPSDAEVYGRMTYGIDGASLLRGAPEVLDRRRASLERDVLRREENTGFVLAEASRQVRWDVVSEGYERQSETSVEGAVRELRRRLDAGMDARVEAHVEVSPIYEFDAVKALDLHHLRYDFPEDVRISRRNIEVFSETAFEREHLLDGAFSYLYNTHQTELAQRLPLADVDAMVRCARDLTGVRPVLESLRATGGGGTRGHVRTVSLDSTYDTDVRAKIADVLSSEIGDYGDTTVHGEFDTV